MHGICQHPFCPVLLVDRSSACTRSILMTGSRVPLCIPSSWDPAGRSRWLSSRKEMESHQVGGPAGPAGAHVSLMPAAGDPKVPVLYQVERTRTGASFSVRFVKAVQHGKPIFICQASFQKAQPSPMQHQFSMPAVPPPEELLSHEALIDQYLR